MLKNPTTGTKLVGKMQLSYTPLFLVLINCCLGLQLGAFWQGTAWEYFFLIGKIKLQLRLFQFRKGKKTHGIGKVNRSTWRMGRGGQRRWVVWLAINELRLKFLMWTGMGVFYWCNEKNCTISKKRTHGMGWVNRSAWWMGKGGQRRWVVGLAVNELQLEFLMRKGMEVF